MKYIVGIDEAGRGPLAGPVAVAAFAVAGGFDEEFFDGIRDSKQLSEKRREEWIAKFKNEKEKGKLNFAVSCSSATTIDRKGIVHAIRKALRRSLEKLNMHPKRLKIFLDGSLEAPKIFTDQKTVIRGDEKIPIIAAASIVAKVHRDRKMARLAKRYPLYGFDIHVGYGTSAHCKAIKRHGPCGIHRRSFLRKMLAD